MKIADGLCMTGLQIRKLLDDADTFLKFNSVTDNHPSLWLDVRDWLRSRRSTRTAAQAAAHYLDLLGKKIMADQRAEKGVR